MSSGFQKNIKQNYLVPLTILNISVILIIKIDEMELVAMAIGERIHFFRTMRGMTQKYLGMLLGFPEKSADVRLAQYETGARTPKADLTASLANVLGVSPLALSVPDIDSYLGLMHTLFTLEDRYGLVIDEAEGDVCLRVNVRQGKDVARLHEMLCSWRQAAAMLKAGEISQEDYDRWRYRYPEFDASQRWTRVPSQTLSDLSDERYRQS